MPQFTITRRLPFRAADLYAIAADVASYPHFVPLCAGARVWDESTDADGRRYFRAAIDIAYPKLRLAETLTSEVTADPVALAVRSVSRQAPAKLVDNRWLFHGLPAGGTDVEFHLAYELSSRMLQLLVSGMFDYAARKIINAFEARAHELYRPVR
ncbi:MAG TPA: type II toxin-antitoxin system RatA family toxin [Aestuariivirgaceae bacterium]|nr:type II toxin-antitoxin system RatA family toxin [Aestuariivirgaceae bacterium]